MIYCNYPIQNIIDYFLNSGQSNPAIPDMRRSVDMPIRQRPNSATDMWRPSSANGVIRPGSAADIMRPLSAAGTSDIANVMRANNVQSPSKHGKKP